MSSMVRINGDSQRGPSITETRVLQRMADYEGRMFARRMDYAMRVRNSGNQADIDRVRNDALGRIGKELEREPGWVDFAVIRRDAIMLRFLNDGKAAEPLRAMVRRLRERIAADQKIGAGADDALDVLKAVARNCGRKRISTIQELAQEFSVPDIED